MGVTSSTKNVQTTCNSRINASIKNLVSYFEKQLQQLNANHANMKPNIGTQGFYIQMKI